MAVSRAFRPITGGLRLARGSIRLILFRAAVVVLSSLPALIAGVAGVASGAARRPYYTEVEGRLPLMHLARVFQELPSAFVPCAVIGVVLAVFADQLLTGGALVLVDPDRPAEEKVSVSGAVFRDGLTHLWAFLRVVVLGLFVSGIGIALIRVPFKRLGDRGYLAGWTGETTVLQLPLLSAVLIVVWLATVGAWVFWSRLITVADGRRRVRRTGLLALRVLVRFPLRSWGIFVALTLGSTLASGAVLVAWRQAEPGSVGGAIRWMLLWLLTVLVQAFIWLWLLRAGRLLYVSERLADLRGKPDEPFRIFSRLAFWRRKKREKTSQSVAESTGEEKL
jgi:hypothetical protein